MERRQGDRDRYQCPGPLHHAGRCQASGESDEVGRRALGANATSCYELTNAQLLQLFEGLLRTSQLVVERADQVAQALRVFAAGKADFADCLIERSAAAAGCEQTMTFDVKASKHARMTLIV